MKTKHVFLFLIFGLFILFPIIVPITAQKPNQVPLPPIPQPEPEPLPIPKKEPKPIEEPFPGLTDEEKFEKLTEENKKIKSENAELISDVENLKIQKGFLQNQIIVLTKKLEDLNAVAMEQVKVILGLVAQLKNIIFDNLLSSVISV